VPTNRTTHRIRDRAAAGTSRKEQVSRSSSTSRLSGRSKEEGTAACGLLSCYLLPEKGSHRRVAQQRKIHRVVNWLTEASCRTVYHQMSSTSCPPPRLIPGLARVHPGFATVGDARRHLHAPGRGLPQQLSRLRRTTTKNQSVRPGRANLPCPESVLAVADRKGFSMLSAPGPSEPGAGNAGRSGRRRDSTGRLQ
jgi:hypothetical protein